MKLFRIRKAFLLHTHCVFPVRRVLLAGIPIWTLHGHGKRKAKK
jgi:hypothetical protein